MDISIAIDKNSGIRAFMVTVADDAPIEEFIRFISDCIVGNNAE